jgi:hypothetical protein
MIEPPRLTIPVIRRAVEGIERRRTPAWIVK